MDYSRLYSTRIEISYDEDQIEILSLIRRTLMNSPAMHVRLINYYKGLPVSYPARIVAVERDIIDLDVLPQQIFAMQDSRCTFIRSTAFKHDLYAKVQYANIKRKAISLRKLCYVEILPEKRDFIRLELEKLPSAMISGAAGSVKGKITELAINAACVRVEDPCSLEIDEAVTLGFMLYNAQQDLEYNVKTPARLEAVEGHGYPKLYRFSTTPDKTLDRMLSQYLFHRQIEIIREIKDAAEHAVNNPLPEPQ